MKSQEIDWKIIKTLADIDNPANGFTTIELTKIIFPDWEEMTNEKFARSCGRVNRRMGAIRHEIYTKLWDELKKRSHETNTFSFFAGEPGRKPDPLGDTTYAEDLKPSFLPFALPVGDKRHVVWRYFNAALHPHIHNVIKNHMIKSEGLEFRARLLAKVYGQ